MPRVAARRVTGRAASPEKVVAARRRHGILRRTMKNAAVSPLLVLCARAIGKDAAREEATPAIEPAQVTAPTDPAPAAKSSDATKAWPPTRRDALVDTVHGVAIPDPYRWLEDEKSPEVQAWMKVQQAYARKHLDGLPGRDVLSRRLSELL